MLKFSIWPQIELGYNSSFYFYDYFSELHSHSVRLALMHTPVYLADLYGFDRNYVFSLINGVLMTCVCGIFCSKKIVISNKKRSSIYYYLILYAITFFMNGRNVLAFFGISLIFYSQIQSVRSFRGIVTFMALNFIGMIFGSVGSGSFLVIFSSCVVLEIFKINSLLRHSKRKNIKHSILLIIYLTYLLAIIYIGVKLGNIYFYKALNFYFYNIADFITHGFGMHYIVLLVCSFWVILLIPSFGVMLKNLYNSKKGYPFFRPSLIVCLIGLGMGLLGYSGLATVVPIIFMILLNIEGSELRGKSY